MKEDGCQTESKDDQLLGIRVLELGEFVAGPIVGRILGDFGAEVIKVESPKGGDQLRNYGRKAGQNSFWWSLEARNKKSITCDLRRPEGQDLARRLAAKSDIVLENFRPGRIAGWGLDYLTLRALNPKLVVVHISGFGQSGPYSDRAGFGAVAEAMGGVRYLTAEPGRPSIRAGFSLGDSLGGLYAAFGAIAALRYAERTGIGQEVDVAITDAIVSVLEAVIVEYSGLGVVREPTGSRSGTAAPNSTYPCADRRLVVIAGNSQSIFRRLMELVGRPELVEDPKFRTNANRLTNVIELDELISAWTCEHTSSEVVEKLASVGVPVGPIYNAADILKDPHFRARQTIVDVSLSETGGSLAMQGVVPKFSVTPGRIHWVGPALGAHNREVYGSLLGLSDGELNRFASEGVI
jgi:crotonobetainyl-CoA:carnitine CoA-transferase CaiB-like acyl-CoA transferase